MTISPSRKTGELVGEPHGKPGSSPQWKDMVGSGVTLSRSLQWLEELESFAPMSEMPVIGYTVKDIVVVWEAARVKTETDWEMESLTSINCLRVDNVMKIGSELPIA